MTQNVDRYKWRNDGCFLPYGLVEKARTEGWLRSLALFVSIKGIYRNGVFYNYNSRKLSALTGMSHSSVNKHIQLLIGKGLVVPQGKHITLAGYKTIRQQYKGRVVFIECDKPCTVYYTLLAQKVIANIRSQEHQLLKSQRKASNRTLDTVVESGHNYVSLSDRCVSRLLGVSNSTANTLKGVWQSQGHIELRPVYRDLGTMTEQQFRSMRNLEMLPPSARFLRFCNKAVERLSDGVQLGFNPVEVNKVLYKGIQCFNNRYTVAGSDTVSVAAVEYGVQ